MTSTGRKNKKQEYYWNPKWPEQLKGLCLYMLSTLDSAHRRTSCDDLFSIMYTSVLRYIHPSKPAFERPWIMRKHLKREVYKHLNREARFYTQHCQENEGLLDTNVKFPRRTTKRYDLRIEDQDSIAVLLAKLSKKQRERYILRYLEGYMVKDIVSMDPDCSAPWTVGLSLKKARERIQEYLRTHGLEEADFI